MRNRSDFGAATRFTLILSACSVLLLIVGTLTIRYSLVDLPKEIAQRTTHHAVESARKIATEVAHALQVQPKVMVGQKTIVEQDAAVLELVTFERALTERRRLDDSWLHSTKTLEVEADFIVRVGFNLNLPFVIEIDDSNSSLRVTLPPAQVLSIDLRNVRFLRDENGFWNKLTAQDREQLLRSLRAEVERKTTQSDITQQARILAEKRLQTLLSSNGRTVIFEPEKNPER